MSRLIALYVFLSFSGAIQVKGQSIYFKERLEYFSGDAAINHGLLVHENNYYLFGSAKTPFVNEYAAAVIRLDSLGHGMDTSLWLVPTHRIGLVAMFPLQQGFLGVGYYTAPGWGNRHDPVFIRYNNHLDTIWTKRIAFGTDTLPFVSHAIMCSDSTIALCGMVNNDANTDQNILFLRLDTLGNVLNFKSIGWTNSTEYCYANIEQTLDGGFIIGGSTTYSHPLSGYAYQLAFKLNSAGNTEWFRLNGRSDAYNGGCLVKALKDSTILMYSVIPLQAGMGGNVKQYIRKLNYQNQQIWYQEYPEVEDEYTGTGPIIELEDSTLVMTRTVWQPARPRLVKFDYYGNYLWNRFVPYGYGNHAGVYVAFVPSDGGFAFSGFYQPNFPMGETGTQDLYIVKTNCLGFDAPPQVSAQFLNPGNFQVLLENNSTHFGQTLINWGDGQSNLYGENDDTLIYHTYPGAGTYSISISAIACGDTATLTQNFTATLTSISEQQEQTFKIWPNPAESLLNIQLSSNESGAWLKITDLSGKVLRDEYLPEGMDYRMLEMGDLSAGVYFISLQVMGSTPVNVKFIKQ